MQLTRTKLTFNNVKKLLLLLTCWFTCCLLNYSLQAQELTPGRNGYRIKTVVIDAGHGGRDPGAIGISGYQEKEAALAVTLKLGKYIEQYFPDVNVVYTRDDDTFVPLFKRGEIANKAKADLFISIHANSFSKSSVYGTEVFVLGLHKTEENLKVAMKENAAILLEEDYEKTYEGFDPHSPESYILMNMATNANIEQSINFAAHVDDQFTNRVHRKSRGVKQAGFIVLHQTAMPSVLIELGFLSNAGEERFLKTKQGQDYMASAIYRAFKDYKKAVEGKEDKVILATPETNAEVMNSKPIEIGEPLDKTSSANKTGVIFKVQVMASAEKLEVEDTHLKNLDDVEVQKGSDGMYRYFSGSFNNFTDAVKHQQMVRSNYAPEAFMVAFNNGKKISVKKAKQELEK